jgi:hypothetical protein
LAGATALVPKSSSFTRFWRCWRLST